MKNRKSFFGFILLALTLVLGVGFATISAIDFTVDGTIDAADDYIKVNFTNDITITTEGITTSNVTASAANQAATVEVSEMRNIGDKAVITFEIENNETDLDAVIQGLNVYATAASDTLFTSDYYSVTVVAGTGSNPTVYSEATLDVVVTVELKRIPLGNVADEASFVVKFSAVPAQPTQND